MKNYDRMDTPMKAFEDALRPEDVLGRTLCDVFAEAPHAAAYRLAKAHGDEDIYFASSLQFYRLQRAVQRIGCDARDAHSPVFSYLNYKARP